MYATGGLYAPTIRHNNGTFYVICTNVIRNGTDGSNDQLQNFIVSTADIYADKWSDPILFEFNGIDTSLFFDTDDKVYICGSKSPGPQTRIMLFEIDLETGEKLTEEKELWNGTGGIYPEGPHIYLRNGFYYLMIAEGGTHEGHSVTMARSTSITGPYEASPLNPILTAAGTDEYVQCTGHCEAFEGRDGEWWGVCLAIRMGAEKLYGLGRETFLVKGHWSEDDWLRFDGVRTQVNVPGVDPRSQERLDAVPGVDLLFIHDAVLSRYNTRRDSYELTASTHDLTAAEASPTFIGKRQRLLEGASSVVLNNIELQSTAIQAGLAVFKDEHRFLRIYRSAPSNKIFFEVFNKAKQIERSAEHQLESGQGSITFSISYTETEYRASFSVDGDKSVELGRSDPMELSGKDFVGPIIGMFVLSREDEAGTARFEQFVVDKAVVNAAG